MALQVRDTADNSRVPFLRGILTRSLQQSGLRFDDAFRIANEIETKLRRKKVITTDALGELVAEHLREGGRKAVARRYERRKVRPRTITVFDEEENRQAFSKGLLVQGLEICGLSEEERHDVASTVERSLIRQRRREISSTELSAFVLSYLERAGLNEEARRYALWNRFAHSGKPLVLLVGGTNGVGKSTIAAAVAHRLNIIRTQSTDMLREVMRLMVPKRFVPAIHTSSFNAWKALPQGGEGEAGADLVQGFLLQSSHVAVAVDGVVRRAEREAVSVIVEGIHIHPEIMARVRESTRAIVVPVVLATIKKKKLKKQLRGRGHQVTSRRADRYLKHFDEIWALQANLLQEAERHCVPIVINDRADDAVRQILDAIVVALDEVFQPDSTDEEVVGVE